MLWQLWCFSVSHSSRSFYLQYVHYRSKLPLLLPKHTLSFFLSLSPSLHLFLILYFFFPSSLASLTLLFTFSISFSLSHHFSSPPLYRPHQRSRSLVSLSLGWHREQADTWEGCFVIQQVIPPWHKKEGGWWDARREGRGREDWAGLYYYRPTYTFCASLCLWADGLSLFSHWWREVSPHYILSACQGFRNKVERGRKEMRKRVDGSGRKCGNDRRDKRERKKSRGMGMKGNMNRGLARGGRPEGL